MVSLVIKQRRAAVLLILLTLVNATVGLRQPAVAGAGPQLANRYIACQPTVALVIHDH